MAAARENQVSLVRVIQQADSLMTKIQQGNGTLGMLATDSTLYRETTATVIQFRELLTDIQAQPEEVPQDLGLLMSKRRAELEVSAGGIVFRRPPDGGAALPADPGLVRQLGVSQGPSRGRRVAGRGGDPGDRRGDRPRPAGAAGTDPGHRLALPLSRPPHPQVLPLLPVRESRRRGQARRRTRGSPTASGARWTRRSRP